MPRPLPSAGKTLAQTPSLDASGSSAATKPGAIGAHQKALEGLSVVVDAGVLRPDSAETYDRQYAAHELFALIVDEEAAVGDVQLDGWHREARP